MCIIGKIKDKIEDAKYSLHSSEVFFKQKMKHQSNQPTETKHQNNAAPRPIHASDSPIGHGIQTLYEIQELEQAIMQLPGLRGY